MGSGKGKSRRSRAVISHAGGASAAPQLKTKAASSTPANMEGAKFDELKWEEFVNNNVNSSTKLFKYYLGDNTPGANQDVHALVAVELFFDAVAVGAIVLPDSYAADDFEFSIGSVASSLTPGQNSPTLAMRSKVRLSDINKNSEHFLFGPHHYFSENTPMSNWYVNYVLREMTVEVNKIVRERQA
jgi:hypothetical protein